MNENTLVAICGYAGDAKRVRNFLHFSERHECPVVILSPEDSPITKVKKHICRQFGKRAYIGQESLDRQIGYFKILLGYEFGYYLVNDSDSFVVSAELPERWYNTAFTLWENQVEDPRPHPSPYPKFAFQPPYFMSRRTMQHLVNVAPLCPAHPITPYVDNFMVALAYEAGVAHRAFTECEHASQAEPFSGTDPWQTLFYRIRNCGTVAMHPIKTVNQANGCARARAFYEKTHEP